MGEDNILELAGGGFLAVAVAVGVGDRLKNKLNLDFLVLMLLSAHVMRFSVSRTQNLSSGIVCNFP